LFFPEAAADGTCRYSRSYQAGESLTNYVRTATAEVRRQSGRDPRLVPEVDLDCFAPLRGRPATGAEPADDPITAYVVHALRWLSSDEDLWRVDAAGAATLLRLEEARRDSFPDPFLFVARKAWEAGNANCAARLTEVAIELGSMDAELFWARLQAGSLPHRSAEPASNVAPVGCDFRY